MGVPALIPIAYLPTSRTPHVGRYTNGQFFIDAVTDTSGAFTADDWPEATRLIEAERTGFEEYFGRLAKQRITFRRVRVVEEPISPYLRWELHVLRLREQCGEQIRIVGRDKIAGFESNGRLPELIVLGSDALYEIRYSEQGIVEGAFRFTDRGTVARCRQFIERLYAEGQDLSQCFPRAGE